MKKELLDKYYNEIRHCPICGSYHFRLLRSTLSALLFLGMSWLFCLVIKRSILDGGVNISLFNGSHWEAIVNDIAWPFSILLIVFLFRDEFVRVLNRIPGFVDRSSFKYLKANIDCSFRDDEQNNRSGTDWNFDYGEVKGIEDSGKVTQNSKIDSKIMAKIILDFCVQQNVLNRLQRTMGIPVLRNVALKNTSYRFAGIMVENEYVSCVEVKRTKSADEWNPMLNLVSQIFKNLATVDRERFIFVAASVGINDTGEQNKLSEMARNMPFRIKLLFCDVKGIISKEIP